jgi:thioester reductase-like protein
MSRPPHDLSRMSPAAKRALLAELLQQKAREVAAPASAEQRRAHLIDQFVAPVTDLAGEAVLDPGINLDGLPVEYPARPERILLTGATGFLGAFLLDELLRRTGATVYCLVRCADAEAGRRRIEQNVASYLPGREHPRSRIIPVCGDLSEPLLGLPPERFDDLAAQIDAIYHNAAVVNWIYSYSRLKPANVAGTQEVLRLASRCRVKPVHVVSSLSVFPLVGNPGGTVIRERDGLDHGGVLYGGYTQSKWVAEKLVTIARSRGLPVAVYRPGIITGHSRTGAWNTDDFLSRLIKSWVELGSAPDLDGAIDMTPVDYVSSALVHLSLSEEALGSVFHLVNPRPIHLREMVEWIRSCGFPLEQLPYDRWRTELLSGVGSSKGPAANPLVPLFSATPDGSSRGQEQPGPEGGNTVDRIGSLMAAQYAARSVAFDDERTRHGLAGSSIVCPQVGVDVFARYLSYFVRTGFLSAPMRRDDRPPVGVRTDARSAGDVSWCPP